LEIKKEQYSDPNINH